MAAGLKGWHIALGEYHWEVVSADTEFMTEALTRAWYRQFSCDDPKCTHNVAFAFQAAKNGITTVVNAKGKGRDMADWIIMGVLAAAEIRYEARTKAGVVA